MNNLNTEDILYIVYLIDVPTKAQKSYTNFSTQLNYYLLKKYPKYYLGSQLYQDKSNLSKFYIVASYKNVTGLFGIINLIQEDISNYYLYTWGDTIKRYSLFSFINSTRLIPPIQ